MWTEDTSGVCLLLSEGRVTVPRGVRSACTVSPCKRGPLFMGDSKCALVVVNVSAN